jgi:predicted DNA-binding transcriptional regulator AlpA
MRSHEHLVLGPSPSAPSVIIRGWKGILMIIPKSRAQIWRDIRAGCFPEPIDLGANSIGWRQADIENWIVSRPRRHYGARAATAANPNEDDKSAVPPAPADADALRGDAPTRHPSPRRGRPLKADTGERMAADAADAAAHE